MLVKLLSRGPGASLRVCFQRMTLLRYPEGPGLQVTRKSQCFWAQGVIIIRSRKVKGLTIKVLLGVLLFTKGQNEQWRTCTPPVSRLPVAWLHLG